MAFGVEMARSVDALGNARGEPVPLRQHHPPEGEQRAGAPAPCSRRSSGALFSYPQERWHTLPAPVPALILVLPGDRVPQC